METQLNSSETDVEDTEQLNTEEVFTENDRHVVQAESHKYSEEEKMQMVLKEISQLMSGPHVLDAYVPDSSSSLKCRSRNC